MAKTRKKQSLNQALLRHEHQRTVRALNDVFIEAQVTVEGLRGELGRIEKKSPKRYKLSAPSIHGKRNIYRETSIVRAMIAHRIDSREYIQSIVFAIALLESYLSQSLACVIRAHPPKLFISAKGKELGENSSPSVDLRRVIGAKDIAEIISERAAQGIREAMYATPKQYFAYCEKIFGFGFEKPLVDQYAEIKATRDVFVHGEGVANEIYIQKSGDKARAAKGTKLAVDSAYFNDSIICLKKILAVVYRGLRDKYKDSKELHKILIK